MPSVATFNCFVGPEGKKGFFGVAAFKRALMAGFTPEEIKRNLEKESIQLGEQLEKILS